MSVTFPGESVEATCYARYEDLQFPDPLSCRDTAPFELPITSQTI